MQNKKIKKVVKFFGITLNVLVILFLILYFTLPAKPRNYLVRQYVFSEIPLGTSWDEATKIIEKHKKWELRFTYINRGIRIDEDGTGIDSEKDSVGAKTMLIELFEYYGPFHTSVQAYLVFDENDELIAVGIRRDVDGI